MKVKATHYICIKDKAGKDLLLMRRGDIRELSKKEHELLGKEANGKFVEVKEDEKNKTK